MSEKAYKKALKYLAKRKKWAAKIRNELIDRLNDQKNILCQLFWYHYFYTDSVKRPLGDLYLTAEELINALNAYIEAITQAEEFLERELEILKKQS